MSIYSNIIKNNNESQLGGIKYRILFTSAKYITSCPALSATKTTDDHYQTATGNFTFKDAGGGFNILEAINRTPDLKWESVGNPGSLKSKLILEFDVHGVQSALARFLFLSKNDDLIMVLERTDCTGKRYLFGGCCLPAIVTKYVGGFGKKPEDDVKTTFTLEANAEGLPVMLADAVVLPIISTPPTSGDFDGNDFDETDFNV